MDFDKYADGYDSGWRGSKSARFYDDLITELEIQSDDRVLDIKTPTLIQFNYSTAAYLQAG